MKTIKILLEKGAKMPERAHSSDAGLDIFLPTNHEPITIFKKDNIVIDTGVHIEIPEGYVGILKSKSGLNIKNDLTGTGVIDAGYTGTIAVKLYNHGEQRHIFNPGDKLIQLLILKCETPEPILTNQLEETQRGDNGFGSTGR